jgi:hypothetical protein
VNSVTTIWIDATIGTAPDFRLPCIAYHRHRIGVAGADGASAVPGAVRDVQSQTEPRGGES